MIVKHVYLWTIITVYLIHLLYTDVLQNYQGVKSHGWPVAQENSCACESH
jgi:hypothetical protein